MPDGPYSRDEEIRYQDYYKERQSDDHHRGVRLYRQEIPRLGRLRKSEDLSFKDFEFLKDELKKIFSERAYDDPSANIEEWKQNRERVWQQRLREKGIGQDGEGT